MYTSFFELLEATPSSDPFHAALADFIRSPDHRRPQALRSLWDQASRLCSCPALASTHPAFAIDTLKDDSMRLEEERALGFKEGVEEGRREGEEEKRTREGEHARELSKVKREGYYLGLEEGQATAKLEKEKELTKQYQAGRSNGVKEGRAAAADEIRLSGTEPLAELWYEKGYSDGTDFQNSRWCTDGHGFHCRMLVSTNDIGVSTDAYTGEPTRFDASTTTDSPTPSPPSELPTPSLDLSARTDWAEDASSIPIVQTFPLASRRQPRDISVLGSGTGRPFGSLQRRRNRQMFPARTVPPPPKICPAPLPPPTPNYATKPTLPPFGSHQDLLSQTFTLPEVLNLLGWSPPVGFSATRAPRMFF